MLLIIAINITFPNLRTFRFKQSASPQCQEQLTRRQKIIAQDFEADGGRTAATRSKTQHQGQTIHCLMRLLSEQQNPDIKVVVAVVSDKCEKALDSLLRQTQVMTDWRADPVLENCK